MPAFLSNDWVTAAKQVQAESTDLGDPAVSVRMNLDVIDVPTEISDGIVAAHLDTSDGQLDLDIGHMDDPEIAIKIDYQVAKAILVDGNSQAGVNAFMAGKVKLLSGDLAKLMAVAQGIEKIVAPEIAQRLKDITD
ncbi:MAG TPA: hypothetical protein VFN21_06780 [Acidimicrobiales bacterium]|nr:hypothetical protein [Acidimicrobiales bacterium]